MLFTAIMMAAFYAVGELLEKDRKENFEIKEMSKEDFFKEMGWE